MKSRHSFNQKIFGLVRSEFYTFSLVWSGLKNIHNSQEADKPPTKCFKHSDRVSKLLEREELDDQENSEMLISKEEHQLYDYMQSKANSED